jgi:hypothetical protein
MIQMRCCCSIDAVGRPVRMVLLPNRCDVGLVRRWEAGVQSRRTLLVPAVAGVCYSYRHLCLCLCPGGACVCGLVLGRLLTNRLLHRTLCRHGKVCRATEMSIGPKDNAQGRRRNAKRRWCLRISTCRWVCRIGAQRCKEFSNH